MHTLFFNHLASKISTMASRQFHYDANMKRKLILNAEENTNRSAVWKFDIDEVNTRQWCKQHEYDFYNDVICKSSTKSFTGLKKKGRSLK